MIDETTGGAAARNASHWRSKSGGLASPASGGTGGPQPARNRRTRSSAAASRTGGGSGIQRFIWNDPLLPPRNSADQAAMASGELTSPPNPPMPPAFATAMASEA